MKNAVLHLRDALCYLLEILAAGGEDYIYVLQFLVFEPLQTRVIIRHQTIQTVYDPNHFSGLQTAFFALRLKMSYSLSGGMQFFIQQGANDMRIVLPPVADKRRFSFSASAAYEPTPFGFFALFKPCIKHL